ncbi:MAG: hypothetical protein L0332_24640 [Chloroflexi bacterium]|nr:hypothetical protein [Chloroflexota bacterium]MCI0646175.1 hypothetical protein [Chloroflexota bacterium]MCI0729885.1 hypothetical protein [Chloroflexota bacterium]
MVAWVRWLGRRWWLRGAVGVVAGLVLLKAGWVLVFWVGGGALIANEARGDLMARRAYLIGQTYGNPAGTAELHPYLPPLFQGEWALGSYSMTAAALANIAFLYPETRQESLVVIEGLIERVLAAEFRQFDSDMWGEDGLERMAQGEGTRYGHIAYLGQLNFMLAAYHYLGGEKAEYRRLFQENSAYLAQSLDSSPFHNGETYPRQIFIPDNAVVVASLALYDRLFPEEATGTAERWLSHMDSHYRDPETGLFVFRLTNDGSVLVDGRGSGAGWNSFFLFYADEAVAQEQYGLLKEHLADRPAPGVAGVREWPHGHAGPGDVDSGPLFLGLSPSGTGFAVAGARHTGDAEFLSALLLTVETAGFTVQWSGERQYLLAPLVGDACLLAMKSVTRWDGRFLNTSPLLSGL